ncbi:tRNA pseudouridine(38-40) synthase TruA [Kallipyga massiliensis]|uniref:tRNA pseudouridine(38-40) synthase TruA n=1 Tax=Kallipyga massiliensis TaxID=1472764 RepID=UPI0004ADD64A|nr:tRNA pseudouridine(38-40) synthase TruA [Kallipyga massiliensis]
MYQNILLTLAYDGRNFHGFQAQADKRTVAGVLTRAVEKVLGKKTRLIAAGRTDAGVHAQGQIVNFLADTPIPAGAFAYHLYPYLPDDLQVLSSQGLPLNFHARFHSQAKTYRYDFVEAKRIHPKYRDFLPTCSYSLDPEVMSRGAALMVGRHNFSAFTLADEDRDPERTIYLFQLDREEWTEGEGFRWIFRIRGDSFLREQVRLMVGALVALGRGKWTLEEISQVIDQGAPHSPFMAAPPQGLTLDRVEWVFPERNIL